MAWWWIPIALLGGAFFGVIIGAVCATGKHDDKGKKWWEE